jgi:hypothetical protein
MLETPANGTPRAIGRPFPWVCPRCRKKEVRLATIAYHGERLVEGQLVGVDIPDLSVPQCANCGELVFNCTADEQILHAVRAKAASAPHSTS